MSKFIYKVAVVESDGMVSNIILAAEGFPLPNGQTGIVLAQMIDDANSTPIYQGIMPDIGWVWDGSCFTPQPSAIESLVSYAATTRHATEISGTKVGDTDYPTDKCFRQCLLEILTVHPGTGYPLMLKACGQFVEIANAAAVSNISMAIREHVQACFDKEKEVLEKITAGQITKTAEIDYEFGLIRTR